MWSDMKASDRLVKWITQLLRAKGGNLGWRVRLAVAVEDIRRLLFRALTPCMHPLLVVDISSPHRTFLALWGPPHSTLRDAEDMLEFHPHFNPGVVFPKIPMHTARNCVVCGAKGKVVYTGIYWNARTCITRLLPCALNRGQRTAKNAGA